MGQSCKARCVNKVVDLVIPPLGRICLHAAAGAIVVCCVPVVVAIAVVMWANDDENQTNPKDE